MISKSIPWDARYNGNTRKIDLSYASLSQWKQRNRAVSLANSAKRNGILIQEPCESCGAEKVQAHHNDYTKPLSVRWLCSKCHRAWHKVNKPFFDPF